MRKIKVKIKELQKAVYAPPAIKITDITLEQNVLGSGSMYESEELEDLEGEIW